MKRTSEISDAGLVLRPQPWKGLGLLLLCLALALVGVWMLHDQEPKGWFVLVFFGVGSLVAVVMLLPNATWLRIAPDGFTFCSLYRSHRVLWQDVAEFGVLVMHSNTLIGFNYHPGRAPKSAALSSALSGWDAALPETYGLKGAELVDLLELARVRFG